ncbi:MAG TPA: hypothetical protein VG938_16050 [Verrucomicrobiae bacterium]|jgi:hypothetical protein|nr:hypothetical protein [Verrucomicrobiae bacterium]
MRAVRGGGLEHIENQVTSPATGRTLQKLMHKKKQIENGAFTACTLRISLLETMKDAAEIAAELAEILLSTAHSSFDAFQNARNCGQKLCKIVKSISWGGQDVTPNINGQMTAVPSLKMINAGIFNFSFRAFLREKHEANYSITQSSFEKGRQARQTHE